MKKITLKISKYIFGFSVLESYVKKNTIINRNIPEQQENNTFVIYSNENDIEDNKQKLLQFAKEHYYNEMLRGREIYESSNVILERVKLRLNK